MSSYDTIICRHCGATIATVQKGAIVRPITLVCTNCQRSRAVKPPPLDSYAILKRHSNT